MKYNKNPFYCCQCKMFIPIISYVKRGHQYKDYNYTEYGEKIKGSKRVDRIITFSKVSNNNNKRKDYR